MVLIRKTEKNVLRQAPIVHRWLNRSVMTKPMIHYQNPFIRYQTKLFTRDKTLYPWPNRSFMTKYHQSVPQWPNHSTVATMTNPCTRDQTIHWWPNRSHPTKPYTCGVWLNVCTAPHHTALGKIQYRTNGNYRTLPSMFPFVTEL